MKNIKIRSKVITFILFFISISFLSLVVLVTQVKKQQQLQSSAKESGIIIRQAPKLETLQYSPNKILVRLDPQTDANLLQAKIQQDERVIKIEQTSFRGYYKIETLPQNSEQVLETLKNDPDIEKADHEIIFTAYKIPNDSYYSDQWWITQIKIPEAWDNIVGNPSIKIAIVDSGVSPDHPDLSTNVTEWKNFSSSNSSYDLDGHGTWVGGVIAAITNNARGVASSTYSSKIMSLKAIDDNGQGTESNISEGIKWAADNGAKIINLSLGSRNNSSLVESAVNYAWNKGAIIIAGAGNDNTSLPSYPAKFSNVFSVASTNRNDLKASFSNFGNWVDIAAPGVEILSTGYWMDDPNNIKNVYAEGEGTSISTPMVSGIAALILSKNPNLTNQQVIKILCDTADRVTGTGNYWTCGRVNAHKAILAVNGSTIPPSTIPPSTPTPPPTNGTTTIKVRFQGITETAQNQDMAVSILRSGTVIYSISNFNASSDSQGIYQILLNNTLANIIPGTYQIKIKGTSHLNKSFQNISVPNNQSLIDLSQDETYQLRSGDVNSDNKITVDDISKVLSYYNDFSTPVSVSDIQMKASDVNKDGYITIQDIALIAINWSDFTVQGD